MRRIDPATLAMDTSLPDTQPLYTTLPKLYATPQTAHHTPQTVHHSPQTVHHTAQTLYHNLQTVYYTPQTLRHTLQLYARNNKVPIPQSQFRTPARTLSWCICLYTPGINSVMVYSALTLVIKMSNVFNILEILYSGN